MLGFNHVLSGSLVAILTPPQYIAYVPLFAFALHFVLDTFPHYGRDDAAPVGSRRFHKILVFDALLCIAFLALALALYPDKALLIVVGVVFSTLPDFLWIFNYYLKVSHKAARMFFAFSAKIQWGERPWAWSLDILYAMIFLTVLVGLS